MNQEHQIVSLSLQNLLDDSLTFPNCVFPIENPLFFEFVEGEIIPTTNYSLNSKHGQPIYIH